MLRMIVEGLTIDTLTNMPIVVLKDPLSNRALPIWIGSFEANAIAQELEGVTTPRPMTHELIKNILTEVNIVVNRVLINDLRENTFYAQIFLLVEGTEVIVDSRPSDAIALALRTNSPIFVAKKVLAKAEMVELSETPMRGEETEEFKEWLENLRPEDFGELKEGL